MSRADRLFALVNILRDGALHRAQDLAARLDVSQRTIYRDMETLQSSGVPVEGSRGAGYRATGATTLPPLTLTPSELEALNLGIAVVAEAADAQLADAARSLGEKIDLLLPQDVISTSDQWKFDTAPFADSGRALTHLPTLRAAISARQKLDLDCRDTAGTRFVHRLRPLRIAHIGRIWILTGWSETQGCFKELRVDLIETARPLSELFQDEPGKTLADFQAG